VEDALFRSWDSDHLFFICLKEEGALPVESRLLFDHFPLGVSDFPVKVRPLEEPELKLLLGLEMVAEEPGRWPEVRFELEVGVCMDAVLSGESECLWLTEYFKNVV
jgi:hypothetical protein